LALEEQYGISITDEEAEQLVTVQDAIDYLKAKGGYQ
jgi:acyl carrier protein